MASENSNQIRNELLRIAADNGGVLLVAHVVGAAQALDSPLHKYFEWSDTEAAMRYRFEQARQLIRVTVSLIGPDERRTVAQVFVSLPSDRSDHGGYRVTASVMSNERQREELLQDALRELKRMELKYRELTELAEVFSAVRAVEAPKPGHTRATRSISVGARIGKLGSSSDPAMVGKRVSR